MEATREANTNKREPSCAGRDWLCLSSDLLSFTSKAASKLRIMKDRI
jgi:hypothetical protein